MTVLTVPNDQRPFKSDIHDGPAQEWRNLFAGLTRAYNATGDFGWILSHTATVEEAKEALGLDQVDNTADLDKPISDLTQAALDAITAGLPGTYQPLDSDLTAIAALATTSYGRGFLPLTNSAAALTYIGTLSTAAIAAAYQPLDSDLTAIAALTTTSYGRGFLDRADAAAALTYIGTLSTAAIAAAYQPLDSDLTSIAALTTTSYGRGFLDRADASAARTYIGAVIGTNVQAYDAFLLSIAALGTAADKLIYTTGVDTAAETAITANARTLIGHTFAQMRADLDVEAGTDFYSMTAADAAFQPKDAELTALAGLTSAASRFPYFTGSGTAALAFLESGSWTPTVNLATVGSSSVSYTVQTGTYYRIGDRVFCQFSMAFQLTIGTGSGNLELGGIPYNSTSTNTGGTVRNTSSNLTWPAGTSMIAMLNLSTTKFGFRALGSNTAAVIITSAHITSGGTVTLAGQFEYQA